MRKIEAIIIVLLVIFGLAECKKPTEEITPEVTETSVEINRNSAVIRAKVNFLGKKFMNLDIGKASNLSDAKHYAMTQNGDYEFVVEVDELTELTDYYYQIEAGNDNFTITTEIMHFTTLDVPMLVTDEVTEIAWTTAHGGGKIINNCGAEVTDCGICWSRNPNPILSDHHASGILETDVFSVNMEGLMANTTYYVRAFATNQAGTSYGNEVSFTTDDNTWIFTANGVSFKMKLVEGGTFQMGYDGSGAWSDEKPVHTVTVSTFFIGQTHVTQELYEAVMGDNPSSFSGALRPVETVSWNTVVNEFIPALNAATGHTFRLPTEAEWEYAARGGRYSHGYMYAGSDDIDAVAWYNGNSGLETHDVKLKQANELGLYDMSGNVLNWCQDWFEGYSSDSQTNPQGPSSGTKRVCRGGSCFGNPCRVSLRNAQSPSEPRRGIGFRVVLVE